MISKLNDIPVSGGGGRALNAGSYRPEIDGLRAFAVAAVIINHFNKDFLPGGYLGVDIFFVISGYVITSSLAGRPSRDLKGFIGGFYERRIRRLVPTLSVFVLLTSLLTCVFNPSPELSLGTGIASLFGVSNLYLLKQSTDYFAQTTELNAFTHTWSLGVEEQFYFLFPFLIWFSGYGRQSRNGARNLFYAIGPLAIISLAVFLWLSSTDESAAYFLMPSRFWEMAAGCLIFIGFQRRALLEQQLEKVPPLLVVALLVAVMALARPGETASTLAVVILTAVLMASLKQPTAAFRLFTHPQVVFVGLISYSLYLWHWGVLSLSRWTIGIHWWSVPFQVVLMLALAVASYRWIEMPLRRGAWFGVCWKTLLTGGGLLFAISACLTVLANPLKGRLYFGMYEYENLVVRSRNEIRGDSAFNGKSCNLSDDELVLDHVIATCRLKPFGSEPTIYFAGNSHADHFRQTHYLLNHNNGLGIVSISIKGCTFLGKPRHECERDSQAVIERWILQLIRPGDLVVISNRHLQNSDKNLARYRDYDWLTNENSISSVNTFNRKVLARGGRTVLMLPLPEYELSIEQCKPMWFRPWPSHGCSKSIGVARSERQDVYSLVNGHLDNTIAVYDPLPAFCLHNSCSMVDAHSKPLYVDTDHITDYANEQYIYPDFLAFLITRGLIGNLTDHRVPTLRH